MMARHPIRQRHDKMNASPFEFILDRRSGQRIVRPENLL